MRSFLTPDYAQEEVDFFRIRQYLKYVSSNIHAMFVNRLMDLVMGALRLSQQKIIVAVVRYYIL